MLDSTRWYEHYAAQYLVKFSQTNQNDYNEAIQRQIKNILIRDYGEEKANVWLVKIVEANLDFPTEIFFDTNRIEQQISPVINELKRNDALDKLILNLNSWFQTSLKLNFEIVGFVRSTNNIELKEIHDMNANQMAFIRNFQPYEANFTSIHKNEVRKEILKQIGRILKKDYEIEFQDQTALLNQSNVDDLYEVDLVYNSKQLQEKLKPIIVLALGFESLLQKLNSWFPTLKDLNKSFVEFLKTQNLTASNLQEVSESKNNPSLNAHLQAFIQEIQFNELVFEEVRNIQHMITFEVMADRQLFEKLVGEGIAESQYQDCVAAIKGEISDLIDFLNEEQLNKMKDHFKESKCIAKEICNRKTKFSRSYLEQELKSYITDVNKPQENEINTGSSNVQDEIDETIYEVIKNILNKKHSPEVSECIVKHMIRTKSVDRIYSANLLFDEHELEEKIKPLVEFYMSYYKKVQQVNLKV